MVSYAGDTWKPSEKQRVMFLALLELDGQEDVTARKLGRITRQTTAGAANTLRSLTRRTMVTPGVHDGDRFRGYQLTSAGRQLALDIQREAG